MDTAPPADTTSLVSVDPWFDQDDFLAYADEVFRRFNHSMGTAAFESVAPFVADGVARQMRSWQRHTAAWPDVDSVDEMTIISATRTKRWATIQVRFTAHHAGHLDAAVQDLTFQRLISRGLESSASMQSRECPNCGAPLPIEPAPRCTFCNGRFAGIGWLLTDVVRSPSPWTYSKGGIERLSSHDRRTVTVFSSIFTVIAVAGVAIYLAHSIASENQRVAALAATEAHQTPTTPAPLPAAKHRTVEAVFTGAFESRGGGTIDYVLNQSGDCPTPTDSVEGFTVTTSGNPSADVRVSIRSPRKGPGTYTARDLREFTIHTGNGGPSYSVDPSTTAALTIGRNGEVSLQFTGLVNLSSPETLSGRVTATC